MTAVDLDFDALLDGLDNASAFSNTSTSPTTTENDSDSGIAGISPMPIDLDNTVIDLDTLDLPPLNMDGQFFDDPNDEFKWFSSNLFTPAENTTFDSLFSGGDLFEQGYQEPLQQIPSPPSKSPDIRSINNVVKLQSCSGAASIGPKCIKLEPKTPSITIIQAAKPVPLTNIPIVTVVTNNSIPTPAIKRRRSDSPANEPPKAERPPLTINELRLQYGNMSDEALKKHYRMIKYRESASLSRKRRKELMENLDTNVKGLTQENEQLKRENERLKTRIHILEMENKILKGGSPRQKPLILMGIVLLVVFNVFTLKSFAPTSTDSTNSIALYNQEAAVVPGRTILSDRRSNSYISANEHDYGPDGISPNNNPSNIPSYPYIQCVAYINKTHSQRINQDLRSWVQDNNKKQEEKQATIIPDPKSLTLPSNPIPSESSVSSIQHVTRKVARQTKFQSDSKGQLQPYKTNEPNYDDFVHTINRKNDTLYFVSFNRDHLILPASVQNQTQRPKMSLILPASMANLNKSIHVPTNHVPMIQIDCEVDDTKLVFVKRSHVPLSHQNELFEYYSSFPQTSI